MSANAPQGAGGGHAEGGRPVGFGSFDGTGTVPDVALSNRDQAITNVVQHIDVTGIATDGDGPGDNDHDYDDPYPASKSAGMNPALPS